MEHGTGAAWPWTWVVDAKDVSHALERNGDMHPDLRTSYLADPALLLDRIERILAGKASPAGIDLVRGLPHAVDVVDLALMRAEGVNVAGVLTLAAGMKKRALARRLEGEAATVNMARASHQPTRGGPVIELFPLLGPGVRKQRDIIVLRKRLPGTVVASLASFVGRPLSSLVSHPLLDPLGIGILKVGVMNPDKALAGDPAHVFITTDLTDDDVPLREFER